MIGTASSSHSQNMIEPINLRLAPELAKHCAQDQSVWIAIFEKKGWPPRRGSGRAFQPAIASLNPQSSTHGRGNTLIRYRMLAMHRRTLVLAADPPLSSQYDELIQCLKDDFG